MSAFWVVGFFVLGLFLGLLGSWLYWRRHARSYRTGAHELQTALTEREVRLQNIKTRMREQEADIERFRAEQNQRDAGLYDLEQRVADRDRSISRLEGVLLEREDRIRALLSRVKIAESAVDGSDALLTEAQQKLHQLQARLDDQGAELACLRDRVTEREATIVQLKGTITESDEQLRRFRSRAEAAEVRAGVFATSLQETEQRLRQLRERLDAQASELAQMRDRSGPCQDTAGSRDRAEREQDSPVHCLYSRPVALGSIGDGPFDGLTEEKARAVPTKVAVQDNLRCVEGIGPEISTVLQQAGISTFAQLAGTRVDQLKQILSEAGLQLVDPRTWPEQAHLAAMGKWDAFEALKVQLKWGRRM